MKLRGGALAVSRGAETGRVTCQNRRMAQVRIRPLGGLPGCLLMILVSVVLSVLLTVGLNLLLR